MKHFVSLIKLKELNFCFNWGFLCAIYVHFSGELFVASSHETEFLLLWNPDHSF